MKGSGRPRTGGDAFHRKGGPTHLDDLEKLAERLGRRRTRARALALLMLTSSRKQRTCHTRRRVGLSHWREFCHFADALSLSPSLLKQLLKAEGEGAAE